MTTGGPSDGVASAHARASAEIDPAVPLAPLAAWLASTLPHLGPVVALTRFPGGFSNLTYHLRTERGEAVLRRPPLGALPGGVAHDMPREARVLGALVFRGVPAPEPLAVCEDPDVLGAPFYVMTHIAGRILRGATPPPDLTPAHFTALSHAFVETLIAIHGATPADPAIACLGKPMGYVARQVDGWTERWERARTDTVPAMDALAAWLRANLPSESGACLVHNDYKYDNLVLDPADPARIVAVLDWEMATVGDPLLDVGTALGYWVEAGDPPAFRTLGLGMTALPGNLTRAELWARYLARSGRSMRPMAFYHAFGVFKIAVIAQQIFARYRKGLTTDARFARLGEAVGLLATMGERAAAG